MCGAATLPDGTCAMGAFKRSGVCQCQSDLTCVCGGACAKPLTDDTNCGVCGLQCGPTSTCNNGVCGPAVVEFVPARPGCGTIDLAVSGGTVYWTDAGHATVQSRPVSGGPVTTIASGEKPTRVAVVGNSVFWLYASSTIRRA